MNNDVKILKKYNKPIIEALKSFRDRRLVSKVCREKLNGMNASRITEIIRGTREITPYYIKKFIRAGILDLKEIIDIKDIKAIPKEDLILFKRITISDETLFLIAEIESFGIDLDALLKEKISTHFFEHPYKDDSK